MTIALNFTIFFVFSMFIFKIFFTNVTNFAFSYDLCCLFVNNFILFQKLIVSIACSPKNLQNFFMQSLPLYTSCLFSMVLSDVIVNIEKPDGICLPTFVVDEFSGLFLYPSIFSIKLLRSA